MKIVEINYRKVFITVDIRETRGLMIEFMSESG